MSLQRIAHPLKSVLSVVKDPRYFQILFLGLFLCYGIYGLGWKSDWLKYVVVISTSLSVQYIAIVVRKLKFSSLLSALITSLGLCLLLKSESYWVLALAATLAISSKFLIRRKGKHLFNPANFGIIASILITQKSWISPGQWGSDILLLAFFGAAGFMILFKISRLETGFTFFAVYTFLLIVWHVFYLGWEMNVVLHKISNGSLLLFAFFMITDPMTIPNDKRARIIWATIIAILSFYVSTFLQINAAGIWILFLFTPLSALFDKWMPATKHEWIKPKIQISTNPQN